MNFQSFTNEEYIPAFTYKSTRTAFVSKVFSIVQAQLLATAVIVLILQSSMHLQVVAEALVLPAFIAGLASSLILALSREYARKTPHNYILLAIFTVSESLLVNMILYQYSFETISKALLTTALLVGAIGYAANKSNYDLTNSRFFAYAALLHLVIVLFSMFIMRIDQIFMAYVGALMFCGYIYLDLQLIMGDKTRMFGVDDYVQASINIYIDIIGLFVKLVQIFGQDDKKKKKQNEKR